MRGKCTEKNTHVFGITAIIAAVFISSSLCGCSKGPSDNVIKEQIAEFVQRDRKGIFGGGVKFANYYELVDIVISDKLIEDKSLTVACTVTFRVKQKNEWPEASRHLTSLPVAAMAFDKIVGKAEQKKPGEVITNTLKFLFKRYEKGWRLEG